MARRQREAAKRTAYERAGASDTQNLLRLRLLPSRAGADGRRHPGGSRCPRHHAHGCRQIDLLPDSRAHAARHHVRGEPARLAHGRPSARAQGGRRPAELPQFHADAGAAEYRAQARGGGLVPDHVRGARAPGRSALPGVRPARGGRGRHRRSAGRGGRGALRIPMGSGFPPRVPADRLVHRGAAQAAGRGCLHGHGDRARASRYRGDAGPRGARGRGDGLRPREPLMERGGAGG